MRSFILLGALTLAACGAQGEGETGDAAAATGEGAATVGQMQTGSSPGDEGTAANGAPITMEEATRRAGGIEKPQPGKYRASVEVLDISLPGAPPQVLEQMNAMKSAGAQTREYCLTPDQADKGFAEMIRQANTDKSCSFSKFDAQGGRIDAVMNCSRPGQGSGRMVMQGTGSKTASDMTMTMDIAAPGGNTMTMKMRSQQERIGDC